MSSLERIFSGAPGAQVRKNLSKIHIRLACLAAEREDGERLRTLSLRSQLRQHPHEHFVVLVDQEALQTEAGDCPNRADASVHEQGSLPHRPDGRECFSSSNSPPRPPPHA